ncbi:MAG: hydroxypyruvate isomerase, partial [Agrococcus casei]
MTGLRFTANLHWLFTEVDFDDRFAAASAAGFRGVEFPDQWVGRTPEIAALLRASNLKQVLINTPA